MAQMALRWILDFDAVSVIIPWGSSPGQALANVTASELPPLWKSAAQVARFYENAGCGQYSRGD